MRAFLILILFISCSPKEKHNIPNTPARVNLLIEYCNEYDKLVNDASEARTLYEGMTEFEKQETIKYADKLEYKASQISYKYNRLILTIDKSNREQYNLRKFLRKVSENW
jgi:hypothetical protein